MFVVIDDTRDCGGDIIVRTPQAGKLILEKLRGQITVLFIDFDLGSDETGADVLKWALQNDCLPRDVQPISMNPVGRKELECVLIDVGYQKQIDGHYILPK